MNDLRGYDGGVLGYACGKWQMEQIGLQAANAGRKVLIIRPFNVIGSRQASKYGMVFPTFIKAAIKHEPLTVYGDGMQTRCFSYVEVFIDCVLKLIQNDNAWTLNNNIFNIGSDEIVSIRSLAEKIIQAAKSNSPIVHTPFQNIFPGQADVLGRVPDTSVFNQFIGEIKWPSVAQIIANYITQNSLE
jgi:UDP-glucose 4-epimerase